MVGINGAIKSSINGSRGRQFWSSYVAYSTSSVADSHIVMICELPGDNTPVVSLLSCGGITDPNWSFWMEQGFSPFSCALTVFSNFPLGSSGFEDSLVTHPNDQTANTDQIIFILRPKKRMNILQLKKPRFSCKTTILIILITIH